jgi:hypothetical protein
VNEWVWSIGGMVLTGENWSAVRETLYSVGGRWMNGYGAMVEWYWQGRTEVLGEKRYMVWVVVEWISMEHRWSDTDSRKRNTGRETCHSATLCTTNLTRNNLGLNPGHCSAMPATSSAVADCSCDVASCPLVNSYRRFGGELCVRLPGQPVEGRFPSRTSQAASGWCVGRQLHGVVRVMHCADFSCM